MSQADPINTAITQIQQNHQNRSMQRSQRGQVQRINQATHNSVARLRGKQMVIQAAQGTAVDVCMYGRFLADNHPEAIEALRMITLRGLHSIADEIDYFHGSLGW
jgi:hypothetical protein